MENHTVKQTDQPFCNSDGIMILHTSTFQYRLWEAAKQQRSRIRDGHAQRSMLDSNVDILDSMAESEALNSLMPGTVDAQLYTAGEVLFCSSYR